MTKSVQVIRLPMSSTFPRIYDANKIVVGIVYLAGYVALDWISFIEPYARFGITPWNPGTGLSFVLVLVFGLRMIPFLFFGPLLSDLIQIQPPLPLTVELSSVALIGGCYSIALSVLTRPRLRFDPALSSMKDLFLLMLVAVASAAVVASGYVTVMISAGLLPSKDFVAATLRYWVGDVIGIIVIAPFALIALNRRRSLRLSVETALQLAAIMAALWLVFGFADEQKFQLFYVLFLPIVWMAVRAGSEGVTVGLLITQLGLILGVTLVPEKGHDVTALQALMLVLATTGLTAGELVTEHRRTTTQLHQHQDSLSRLAQLGSMGELAAAVAHELNQPLMAAGTYARLVEDAIRTGDVATGSDTAKKAVAQIDRAAEVLRRLRALIRLDRSARVACTVERIVKDTLTLCQHDLDRIHASAKAVLPADLPPVMVDALQVEQALLNLLRNSIEAISNTEQRSITIEASVAGADFVEVAVRDSGPGFPADRLDNPFLPFASTKAEGLGFGLPLCKSIIEAHGGQLWLDRRAPGAVVRFTLPVAEGLSHG